MQRSWHVFNTNCLHFAGLPDNLRGGIATVMFQLPVVRHNYAWAGCMPAGALLSFTNFVLDLVTMTKHAAAVDWPPPSRHSCMLYTCVLF